MPEALADLKYDLREVKYSYQCMVLEEVLLRKKASPNRTHLEYKT